MLEGMNSIGYWRAFILAALPLAGQDLDVRLLESRTLRAVPLRLSFEVPEGDRVRWVRLRNFRGSVKMNGVALIPRPEDQVTSTLALTPYLHVMGTNQLEFLETQTAQPVLESLPRVFLAGAASSQGRLRILIENTLDNAVNVQVELAEAGTRDAYVPPESQSEIEFVASPDPSTVIRLTKFPEAIEAGYNFRAQLGSLAPLRLRDSAKGAMVLGIGLIEDGFHILELLFFAERPKGRGGIPRESYVE
jgi:hypothetical protein